ncbi:uncharacterized protein LOC131624309 [Vicia villosa]|uniref:uncharacterized protein LOC131624309 n=1 Tax=Vicia villosa TaxID=3911 RepID=UPI00273C72F8|nr:uncharacterized protein LOC131624309 [Vicia villosa]
MMKSQRIPRTTYQKSTYSINHYHSVNKVKNTSPTTSNFNFNISSSESKPITSMSNRDTILEPLLHVLDPISLILNHNSNSDQPCPLRFTSLEDSFIMERGPNYNAYAEFREKRLRLRCLMEVQEENSEIEIEPVKLATTITKQVRFQDESFEIESQKLVAPTRKNANFQSGLAYGRRESFGKEVKFEIEKPKLVAPTRKEVKFQGGVASGRKGSYAVAQSVPDFSAVLRKENRKPSNFLPSVKETKTPPPSKSSFYKDNNMTGSSSRGSKSESAQEKKKTIGGGGGVLMGRKSYASLDELKSLSSATAIAINGEGRGGRNSRVLRKSVSVHRQF